MKQFSKLNTVKLVERTEVVPTLYIENDVLGLVIDKTVPNYYLVKFVGYGAYWLEGNKLEMSSETLI